MSVRELYVPPTGDAHPLKLHSSNSGPHWGVKSSYTPDGVVSFEGAAVA